jgi:hypothetical protein
MRAIAAFALVAVLVSAARAEPAVSDIAIIPIRDGVNQIERFAADGRPATIVEGWRDNGNAHGHCVYLVMLPPKENYGPGNTSGVVTFDDGKDGLQDTIGVSPFDGERVLGSVRFARAKLDGKPATIVIRADLADSASGVLADHAPVEIRIYRLDGPGIAVGTTPDVFDLVATIRPQGFFCNADMAIASVLHLALPAEYAGGKTPSGCAD